MSKMYTKVPVNKPERETEKAWGIDLGETEDRVIGRYVKTFSVLSWLPKSKCKVYEGDDGEWFADAPKWLGDRYGFDYAVKHCGGSIE